MEFSLLKKYACGDNLSDDEYEKLFDFIMIPISRTRNINYKRSDEVLEAFGVQVSFDDKGNKKFILRENKLPIIKAETWEYIIIDLLKQPAMNIINRFDFASTFIRHVKNSLDINELQFNLGAWKFSDDKSEQSLSNALRAAFMFTVVSYCYGDVKTQYDSFSDFFNEEYYKRVSLVYAIWINRGEKESVEYLPLYDSFYNLNVRMKFDDYKSSKSFCIK